MIHIMSSFPKRVIFLLEPTNVVGVNNYVYAIPPLPPWANLCFDDKLCRNFVFTDMSTLSCYIV
jgi:hypothetical protein